MRDLSEETSEPAPAELEYLSTRPVSPSTSSLSSERTELFGLGDSQGPLALRAMEGFLCITMLRFGLPDQRPEPGGLP